MSVSKPDDTQILPYLKATPTRQKHSLSLSRPNSALRVKEPRTQNRQSIILKTQFSLSLTTLDTTQYQETPSVSGNVFLESHQMKEKDQQECPTNVDKATVFVTTPITTPRHGKKDSAENKEKVGKTEKVEKDTIRNNKSKFTLPDFKKTNKLQKSCEFERQKLKKDFVFEVFEDAAKGRISFKNTIKSESVTPRKRLDEKRMSIELQKAPQTVVFKENSEGMLNEVNTTEDPIFVRMQKYRSCEGGTLEPEVESLCESQDIENKQTVECLEPPHKESDGAFHTFQVVKETKERKENDSIKDSSSILGDDGDEYGKESEDKSKDGDEEISGAYTYITVDKEDLDLMISSDENRLKEYLKRNRISVGFPIKGYKEALVLDIRNGDDNPKEQIKGITNMMERRKCEFLEKHGDDVILDEFGSSDKTIKIVKVIKKGITSDKEKISPLLTGFEDLEVYMSCLDEKEKSQMETYKNTLMELWFTEEAHVQSLDILLNCYLKPISRGKYAKIVQKMKMQIEQLHNLHSLFYTKLSKRIAEVGENNIPMIADLLRYFFHFVKSTCPYIVEYNSNLKDVNLLVRHRSVAQVVDASRKAYEEMHPGIVIQRFQSYLIMPIQRIPRYVLLIKDMLKNAPPLSPDTDKLVECYKLILDVAAWINEKKLYEEEREKYDIVLRVITGLYDLNKSYRRFIVSGFCKFMDQEAPEKLKEGYFFLFNDVLIETVVLKHKGNKVRSGKQCVAYQEINEYGLVEDFKDDLFQVHHVYMVSEEAVVSYCTKHPHGPSLLFQSPLSFMEVTLVFETPVDANAWFVALAYTIQLAPRLNESKSIFNIRND
ncbi:Rho/RAC guanine nucleotide exchange factor, putative [Entamoeba invadens IP1]|uniref:Rho/RAC guanine nucleotide exchange factor, putative n=1 Tax=Entamoeba invadens IP1 TaxID=370355 RepID=A0A0A1U7P1_ENTIV|nr:Rho/RAC guanine nucleotide exchange factor, putative [Entamoeba invadens IP1]ELP90356.1 Rho/RAC guanine nucleotide exchange factor, putative [Entamoeba invadens IP1]|eukprot:XP_004257127.1 Rho/RAC guanine nucleotide exchange factor, putative [Entamoeba invadens IP1]